MEFGLLAVIAVVLLVGVSVLGSKIRIAAPLLLVVIGIGYLPFVPLVEIEPEIILVVVLPPLLYAAAINVPLVDFRRNFRPVIGLSVILVVFSALVIGVIVHWLEPEIPLPAAIALGAVISPTDAVAATTLGKRLGMPERIVAILEGESLVNDATSLVLLRTALAAISGGFVFWSAASSFLYSVIAAIAVGYVVGMGTVWLRSKLTSPVHDTIISFVVPFIAFLPAEELHASGVLAVVVTGLYTGHHAWGRFSATARVNERLNWRTVQFVLENGVFLLMGLQLHALAEQVIGSRFEFSQVALVSLALVAILILCRAAFMVPLITGMRLITRRYERRNAGFSRTVERAHRTGKADVRRLRRLDILSRRSLADLAHERQQQLGWRDGIVLSWSGMRGVVTLAAAQSIPVGVPFRPQLVVAAFSVAVITLLLHGLTLPPVIHRLWPRGPGSGRELAELEALSQDLFEAASNAIEETVEAESPDPDPPTALAVERARISAQSALAPLSLASASARPTPEDGNHTVGEIFQRLSKVALEAQRAALLEERAIGRYSSRALRVAELALDAFEAHRHPPPAH